MFSEGPEFCKVINGVTSFNHLFRPLFSTTIPYRIGLGLCGRAHPWPTYPQWPTARRVLLALFLSRPLYVLDHLTQFVPELLVVVINAVHISARPANALNDPTCLSYVLLTHLVQRKLR